MSRHNKTNSIATNKTTDLKADNKILPKTTNDTGYSILNFRVQALIIAILGFVFYANTCSHQAAFDDRMAITDNDYVQSGLAGIPDILTKDAYQSYLEHRQGGNQLAGGRYRPLSLVTFAVEQQIMGVSHESEQPLEKKSRIDSQMPARHVVNVLLYILAIITLLYFLRKVVFPDEPLIAIVTALIFTVHPLHTEVVANVKSRDEILSILFISLTFIKSFNYLNSRKISDLLQSLLFFLCALLSKEYAVTLILFLPISFYLFNKIGPATAIKASLPYLAPLALYFMMRFNAVSDAAAGAESNIMNNPYLLASAPEKLASELLVLLNYLKLLVFPGVLCSDYSYNQLPYTNFGNPLVWLSIALYTSLITAMFLLWRKRHVLGFAIAFYLGNMFLVSNLIFNIGAPMGERLAFHSSVGFSIIIAWLLCYLCNLMGKSAAKNTILLSLVSILIVLSGFKTIQRNKDWKNDETLFFTDVKTAPNSVLTNNNAAAACMSEAKKNKNDKPLCNEWFTKAIGYFDKAIALYPKHVKARLNRGICHFNMGNAFLAVNDWDSVRKYEPNAPELAKCISIANGYYYNQAINFARTNKPDSALFAYKKCVELTPEKPESWFNLASAFYASGKIDDAASANDKALQLAPNYPDAKNLRERLREQKAIPHP